MVNINKLTAIEEKEELIKESQRIKEYEQIILNSNIKKYAKEIKQQEIKIIREEFNNYLKENNIDFYERQALQDYIRWQVKKALEG